MPGCYETANSGSPQSLNGAAQEGTPAAVESVCSQGRSIALVAVLVFACLLVAGPAVVAGISMVNPGALDQTLAPLLWVSPITSHFDLAKLVVGAGSVVMVWRVDEA
jgi:hypothetical protein